MGVETALIVGTALSAGSALYSGYQAREQGQYEQAQADADAQAAIGAGKVEAERIRKITKQRQAAARAALASSGVSVDVGSGEEVQRDILQAGEQDALTAILSGRNTGQRLRAEGAGAASRGQQELFGSVLGAGGALAQGYGRWKRMAGAEEIA